VQLDIKSGNYLPTDISQPDLCCSRSRQSLKTLFFGQWDQSAVWTSSLNCTLEIVLLTYFTFPFGKATNSYKKKYCYCHAKKLQHLHRTRLAEWKAAVRWWTTRCDIRCRRGQDGRCRMGWTNAGRMQRRGRRRKTATVFSSGNNSSPAITTFLTCFGELINQSYRRNRYIIITILQNLLPYKTTLFLHKLCNESLPEKNQLKTHYLTHNLQEGWSLRSAGWCQFCGQGHCWMACHRRDFCICGVYSTFLGGLQQLEFRGILVTVW